MDNSACMAMARVAQAIVYNNEKPLDGSDKHLCARYSANMAYAFVNGKYSGASYGDMGTASYYNAIQNLGYTMVEHEPSISKNELAKKLAAHTNWYAGSIACYRGLDGSGNQNRYGHAQFYLGDGAWTCDRTNNYDTCFVYNSKNSTIYDFRLFKPNNEPAVCVEGNYCLPEPTDTSNLTSKVEHVISWSIKKAGYVRTYSNVTAQAFINASQQYNIDLPFMLSVAHWESHCGCGSNAKKYNGVFSEGMFDDGTIHKKFSTMDESVYSFAKLIRTDYLRNGKTIEDLLKPNGFVNYAGKRYATAKYENGLSKTRNQIIMSDYKME